MKKEKIKDNKKKVKKFGFLKILITAVCGSVILSSVIFMWFFGWFSPKTSIEFATKGTFISTTVDSDGNVNTNEYAIIGEELAILKEIFSDHRLYSSYDATGFDNYIFKFSDGTKVETIRLSNDDIGILMHDKGYFSLSNEEYTQLYMIISPYI